MPTLTPFGCEKNESWVLTLFNCSDTEADADVVLLLDGTTHRLHFGKYELKTLSLAEES